MRTFTSTDELEAAIGEDLGATDWIEIDQDRVTCSPTPPTTTSGSTSTRNGPPPGPFGGTIAHGYLTLSLIPRLSSQIFTMDTPGARLNYGLNKVRFPNPVRVGARVRGRASLVALDRRPRPASSSPSPTRSRSRARPSRRVWPRRSCCCWAER